MSDARLEDYARRKRVLKNVLRDAFNAGWDARHAGYLGGREVVFEVWLRSVETSVEVGAFCEDCGMGYEVDGAEIPITTKPYTCNDCGGYVDVPL